MRKIFELTTYFAIGVVLGQLIINKMTTKSKIMKYVK
jgi:hypothetical protein